MSLKTIHIVFIVASCLLTVFFGYWAWSQFLGPGGSRADLAYGVISIGAFFGLLAYGKYFLNKLKHISYL
jgi:DNA-binding transcriptional regulator of glucitol operon